jgi:chromosome segregation ATPase
MSEANIDRLHEEIFELKQDIEEYERRLSVSNETIDIYEKLVKHVETQRDDLYQELQSNEMLINELEQQNKELRELLDDVIAVLVYHEQSYDSEWLKDYQDVYSRYEQIIT